jgi:CRISPR-associated protein Cas5d
MEPKDQALDVWGDLACFSQPPFKVERFSYPVITPSAARGIYDSIYCKSKEFRWQLTGIEILTPPTYIALRRNEVKEKISLNAVLRWMDGKETPEPIWADGDRALTGSDEKGRTQRQTMALKDVRYRLHAHIRPWPGFENTIQGLEAQFRRRAAHGKCIYQPYFGCREFAAYFELVEPEATPAERIPLDMELGLMLYDVFDLSRPGDSEDKCSISLFHASIQGGELRVPPYESANVLKGIGRAE